jgi:hypothetical protein
MAGTQGSFMSRLINRSGWRASAGFDQVYTYMTVLARHMNQLAGRKTWYRISQKPGTLFTSTSISNSFDRGAAVVGWQARDISFATTYSYAQEPRDLFTDLQNLPRYIQDAYDALRSYMPQMQTMLDRPENAEVAIERAMNILAGFSNYPSSDT